MLHLNNINVHLNNNHILRNLSCQVEHGDFIVIVGANGAGKSTFFDTIAGKIIPQTGTIIVDGSDITKQNEQKRSGIITRIFQNTHLNSVGSLTVAQNLAIAHYSRRPARLVNGMQALSHEHTSALIKQVGMHESILHQPMCTLSGGQRQLISFAMATLLIPKILLLDEPTAALDPQAATTLLCYAGQFIKKHSITTLLITHDQHIALSMGNKIWVLDNGTITKQYSGPKKNKINPADLIGQIDYDKIALDN